MTKGSKVDKEREPFREKVELIFHSGSVPANSMAAVLGKERCGELVPAAMSSAATADGKSAGGILGYCRQSANTVHWIGRGRPPPPLQPSPLTFPVSPTSSSQYGVFHLLTGKIVSILHQIKFSSAEDNSHGHLGDI